MSKIDFIDIQDPGQTPVHFTTNDKEVIPMSTPNQPLNLSAKDIYEKRRQAGEPPKKKQASKKPLVQKPTMNHEEIYRRRREGK